MKTCKKCSRDLALSAFARRSASTDGLQTQCKDCDRDYRTLHKEQRARDLKEYTQLNKDRIAARQSAWYILHQEEISARKRTHYIENRSEILATQRIREAGVYALRRREVTALRRALENRVAIGTMPNNPLAKLIKIYGPECIVPGCSAAATTKDHVIPLTKGGPHSFDNFQPMCKSCNSRKGNRSSTDYRGRESTSA